MTTSCVVYKITTSVDIDQIYAELSSGESYSRSPSHIDNRLITDVERIESTDRGFESTVRYDIEETRPVRERENPWYNVLHKVNTRVTGQYFILNSFNSEAKAARETARLLGLSSGEYEKVEFSPATILSLWAEDGEKRKQGSWKDPTEHADIATLYGDIDDSALVEEFNIDGDASWLKFDSRSNPGRQVGLSTNKGSVVFSSGWVLEEMEDYILEYVIDGN